MLIDVIGLAERNQKNAYKIIEDSQLIQLWEAVGAEVYVVGSVKTGLLINRDIDIHVYTDKVSVKESFMVMAELAGRLNARNMQYINSIDTEEECVEWHSEFEDVNGQLWKLDLIHIRRGSKFDGVVERVTEAIGNKLSPEIKDAILRIKYDAPEDATVPGIEVYYAVFEGKVKTYREFLLWRQTNKLENSLEWLP